MRSIADCEHNHGGCRSDDGSCRVKLFEPEAADGATVPVLRQRPHVVVDQEGDTLLRSFAWADSSPRTAEDLRAGIEETWTVARFSDYKIREGVVFGHMRRVVLGDRPSVGRGVG